MSAACRKAKTNIDPSEYWQNIFEAQDDQNVIWPQTECPRQTVTQLSFVDGMNIHGFFISASSGKEQ